MGLVDNVSLEGIALEKSQNKKALNLLKDKYIKSR